MWSSYESQLKDGLHDSMQHRQNVHYWVVFLKCPNQLLSEMPSPKCPHSAYLGVQVDFFVFNLELLDFLNLHPETIILANMVVVVMTFDSVALMD